MIIEFSFGNFRSFRDPVTLSLAAANIKSENKSVDDENLIIANGKLNLLTSAAIYGPNASGKSNLIRAFGFMRQFVLNSSRETLAGEDTGIEPFLFDASSPSQPSFFEVVFLDNGVRFRYGFELTKKRVEREWLYMTPTIREAELYVRQAGEFQINTRRFQEGRGLVEKTRSNALFLSVVAQFNGKISRQLQTWFRNCIVVAGLQDMRYQYYTIEKFKNDKNRREQIKNFIRRLDLDIEDILIQELDLAQSPLPKDFSDEFQKLLIKFSDQMYSIVIVHKKFDEHNRQIGVEPIALDDESAGTQKIFYLAGPVVEILMKGGCLWIDEIDARVHPKLTQEIIQLFNSRQTNPRRAQLIFTTHETNLLDRNLFRRDQIWFTEKDHYGASHLYSLVEFKPRNDVSYEKDYLRGKYGAIPFLSDIGPALEQGRMIAETQGDYEAEDG